MLAFASVYFFESGLFNDLRAIQTKIPAAFQPCVFISSSLCMCGAFLAFRFSSSRRPKPGFDQVTRTRITSIQKFSNKLLHEFAPRPFRRIL